MLYLFMDGIKVAYVADTNNYSDATSPLVIGALNANASFSLNSFMHDFRITKGKARYTTNFSVPTEANPTVGASF